MRWWPAALLIVVVACSSGGDSDEQSQSPSTEAGSVAQPDETTAAAFNRPASVPIGGFPLTGEATGTAATSNQPALVVKIDNAEGGRPQHGLAEADLVYEILVEGGLSRFAAVYHSRLPTRVGPVRSARQSDLTVLLPLTRPMLASSGYNKRTEDMIRTLGIVDVSEPIAPGLYSRDPGRSPPYDLMTSAVEILELSDALEATPPAALLNYRTDAAPVVSTAVGAVEVDYGATSVRYEWSDDDAAWLRFQNGSPHVDADGEQLRSPNVIVQIGEYIETGDTDADGVAVVAPAAGGAGRGSALFLLSGGVVQGEWSRGNITVPTLYADIFGDQRLFSPGPTWILLAPPGSLSVERP